MGRPTNLPPRYAPLAQSNHVRSWFKRELGANVAMRINVASPYYGYVQISVVVCLTSGRQVSVGRVRIMKSSRKCRLSDLDKIAGRVTLLL